MLNYDEADIEIFFDSADFLPLQNSVLDEELGSNKSGYEVWVNKPQSVKERRQRFFQEMGFSDFSSNVCSQEINCLDLERIMESEGAVSSAFSSSPEANFLFDEHNEDVNFERKVCESSSSSGEDHRPREAEASEECQYGPFDMGKKKMKGLWKLFMKSRKTIGGKVRSKLNREMSKTRRVNVKQNKKRWMELSALYLGQEIRAHEGLIWTMKFSPNGQYLASGGEDGVVRVWRVISMDTSNISFNAEDQTTSTSKVKQEISCSWRKKSNISFMALPNKVLQIEESPLQEFFGHTSDVLDLAWSDSNILLSSSMDKTVRLWQIGCDQCMGVFRHNDYVTCIQVNPVDKNYFISGSIDGKVRIWGLCEERVVDWADVRDVITAVSYQPDGKGFVVGSITGACRFYIASGKHFQLEEEIWVHGKKRSAGNKITGIQFSQKKHQRVMITSEDSKVRVFDGFELIQKFKGNAKSGSQMCGSFTSTENHIISVGEDSQVYIWNCNDLENSSSKPTKSERCCEYFSTEGSTVAIPWLVNNSTEQTSLCGNSEMQLLQEARPSVRDSERFSLGNWFTMEGTCRGSVTWPEEKLPSWNLPFAEEEEHDPIELFNRDAWHDRVGSETWGLSFVVAGLDGTIKTFHNFGLPVRL